MDFTPILVTFLFIVVIFVAAVFGIAITVIISAFRRQRAFRKEFDAKWWTRNGG